MSGLKVGLNQIINKHFDTELAARFSVLYETDYLKESESRTLYDEAKAGLQVADVYFDGEFVCEISNRMTPSWAELRILDNFTDLYKRKKIKLTQDVAEVTEN